jgi:hypothetical protein
MALMYKLNLINFWPNFIYLITNYELIGLIFSKTKKLIQNIITYNLITKIN